MVEVIDELRQELEEMKEEHKSISSQMSTLAEKQQTLTLDISACERTIAKLSRKHGLPDSGLPAQSNPSALSVSNNGSHISVQERIAEFIRNYGSTGTDYSSIRKFLMDQGIKVHKNYPYVCVSKLKESGKVREVGGKLISQ